MAVLIEAAVCLSIAPEIEHRPVVRRMSVPSLSSEVQLRYLLQWFSEFSELQREDFLPILAAAKDENCDQLAAALALLNCQDKPVSLFQCRLKLFNEWYPTWSEDQRGRLVKGITEQDSDFANKLHEFHLPNGTELNGEFNGIHDIHKTEEVSVAVEENEQDLGISEVKEEAIQESIPDLDDTVQKHEEEKVEVQLETVEKNEEIAAPTELIQDNKVNLDITNDS